MNPTSCLFGHGLYWHKLQCSIFRWTVLQKCLKNHNCYLDCGSWVEYSNIPQSKPKRAALWRIFSTNKSAPANRKKGFYTNRDPNKQEVGFIFVWTSSELWRLFKYSKLKLKNQNLQYSCWCPFRGRTSGINLMPIQSGQTIPLTLSLSLVYY
jgi:hypothetical protein